MRKMPGKSLGTLRFLLILGNGFGLIVAIVGLISMLNFTFSEPIWFISNGTLTTQQWAGIFALISFILVGNIYYCSFIIHFVRTSDDATLINNRWIIALFSLSVGGFMTPYVLSQMPNIGVKSTIDPKFTISKGYGGNALIAGSLTIGLYFLMLNALKLPVQFDLVSQIVWIAFGIIILWGAINLMLFATPNAKTTWENKKGIYGLMNFIAVINTIYATFILLIQIILSILSIISIIAEMFDRRNGFFGAILTSMYGAMRIAMQLFIIYTINKTIKGLWSKQGEFEYGVYSNLAEKQRQYEMS
ncbi:hypothetical protein [Spiroplasma taiwanense]|uniref:Transmembrane protein n=1 Tax=Spiroplasma taiwanense CT-1 TaxID=1276220 RepID=S5M0L1_9MOLU|nr:hypothetical protein [Spiroplasma taiwanense]AGR41537.1 hypothetical protein STAIW_v1c09510 [Spiroplasma taiwanense CT-1]